MSSIEEEKQYLAHAELSRSRFEIGCLCKTIRPRLACKARSRLGAVLSCPACSRGSRRNFPPVACACCHHFGRDHALCHKSCHISTGQVLSYRSIVKSTPSWAGDGPWLLSWPISFGVFRNSNLGTAAITQNLNPNLYTPGGKAGIWAVLLILAMTVIWISDRGSIGAKIFDWVLKIMVGLIVIAFFGVVVKMAGTGELEWGKVAKVFVPDLSLISRASRDLCSLSREIRRVPILLGKQDHRHPKGRHGCRRRYCRRC